jgi:hypothetical protein
MKKLIPLVVVCMCLFVSAYADELNTTVYINGAPYLDTLYFTDNDSGNLQVYPDDSGMSWCYGNFSDVDGSSTVVNINATFYGPSFNVNSPVSFGAVYFNDSCTLSNLVGMTGEYNCSAIMYHHSEPGLWSCNVSIIDDVDQWTSNVTTNTVDDLVSIQVPPPLANATHNATLDFGYYALGQNSTTTDFIIDVNNSGNVAFNVTLDPYRVSATPVDTEAMACTVGNLPATNILFDLSPGTDVGLKTALSDAPTPTGAPLAPTAFGSIPPTTQSIYFGIIIPTVDIGGRCAGFMDIESSLT